MGGFFTSSRLFFVNSDNRNLYKYVLLIKLRYNTDKIRYNTIIKILEVYKMEKLLPKVQGKKFSDALITGGVKAIVEKMIAQTPVGNGNLISSGVKLVGSAVVPNGKYSSYLKDALGIDAVEDAVNVMFKWIEGQNIFNFGGQKQNNNNTI